MTTKSKWTNKAIFGTSLDSQILTYFSTLRFVSLHELTKHVRAVELAQMPNSEEEGAAKPQN